MSFLRPSQPPKAPFDEQDQQNASQNDQVESSLSKSHQMPTIETLSQQVSELTLVAPIQNQTDAQRLPHTVSINTYEPSSIFPWTLDDPLVQSKIVHLYRMCTSLFTKEQRERYEELMNQKVKTDEFKALSSVVIGWFDTIINQIGDVYWMTMSRKQVWDVLVARGELSGAWEEFVECGSNVALLTEMVGQMNI